MAENRIKNLNAAGLELWEMQTDGTLWICEYSKGDKQIKVQGKGDRLRISTSDRQLTQERVKKEEHDPFINGMLVRRDADQQEDPETASPSAKSDEDLAKLLSLKQAARFQKEIEALSETALRRFKDVAQDNDASLNQMGAINDLIADRYATDKSTRYETPEFEPKVENLR